MHLKGTTMHLERTIMHLKRTIMHLKNTIMHHGCTIKNVTLPSKIDISEIKCVFDPLIPDSLYSLSVISREVLDTPQSVHP